MATASFKVNVSVAKLKELINRVLEKENKAFEEATKKYENDRKLFEKACIDALTASLEAAKKGKFPTSDYSYRDLRVTVGVDHPLEPNDTRANTRADLQLLEMAADEVIPMTQVMDRFHRYLGVAE